MYLVEYEILLLGSLSLVFVFNRKSVLLNSIEKQASKQTKNAYMDSNIVIINLGAVFSLRFSKDR